MTDRNTSGPTGSTKRQSVRIQDQQNQEKTAGRRPAVEEEEDSEEDANSLLQAEIARLSEQVERLTRERTLHRDDPVPSTKSPLTITGQPVGEGLWYPSATPELTRVKLTERTPTIDNLSDGVDPTFRQWQASIVDRLEINSDHYQTERARMALVWGHTTGIAKGYLEPQYLSDLDGNRFQNAEDMIALLKSYFVSGNEQAESRAAFHRLLMDKGESFSAFKARFISTAVKGAVAKSEWSFYLWEKITPALRVPNLGFRRQWGDSFEQMVEHLTAFDMERKNTPIGLGWDRRPSPPRRTKPRPSQPHQPYPISGVVATPSDPPPTPPRAPSGVPRLASKTPVPERQATPGNCYNCGKPGHFVSDCPAPRVRKIEAVQEEDVFEEAAEYHSDEDRMGNDEA
jgi:hypothetical protein